MNPGRRAVLGLALTAGAFAGSGCNRAGTVAGADGPARRGTGAATPRAAPPVSTDLQAATRAAHGARELLTAAAGGGTGRPAALAALLARVAQDHQQHLDRLAVPSAAASPGSSPASTAAGLAQGESAAARSVLGDIPPVSRGLAALLAQIAASRAVHADLITVTAGSPAPDLLAAAPTAPAGSGDATTSALSRLLAGEHAAVFAYGLVTARTNGSARARARSMWRFHQAQRDVLEQALIATGVHPPAARPAYDLGDATSAEGAGPGVAATVEAGLAAIWLWAVSITSGPDRAWAAGELVAAARRTSAWTGRPLPFPGQSKPLD